ncbi:hypothetical protein [Bacillus sp. AFS017336]|uniref:hypothetical protein n=1 Tax=Bacillus sp. AFS017336 TaxID=2033489 RepID=UPI000BF143C9|nr:hypothetical protein [Bacillus sp. AFS017336]PEL11214.1 hypothetical protein CN601_10675 [Bacillus sp. AFS017336]QKE71622.1 hypothetical protein HPK19_01910 [Arthrobacter citreus]
MMKIFYKIMFLLIVMSSILPSNMHASAATKNDFLQIEGYKSKHSHPVNQIPKVTDLFQVSTNQILVTFDAQVELSEGTKASVYWIQSLSDAIPTGIASLGNNSKFNASNALSSNQVTITKVQGDNNSFLLTFKQEIPSNKRYKLVVRNLNAPGAKPFNGLNGMKVFTGK